MQHINVRIKEASCALTIESNPEYATQPRQNTEIIMCINYSLLKGRFQNDNKYIVNIYLYTTVLMTCKYCDYFLRAGVVVLRGLC